MAVGVRFGVPVKLTGIVLELELLQYIPSPTLSVRSGFQVPGTPDTPDFEERMKVWLAALQVRITDLSGSIEPIVVLFKSFAGLPS